MSRCRVMDCPACGGPQPETPICQPPSHLGRRASLTESAGEVANWLREQLPEMWNSAPSYAVLDLGWRLILLRAQVENGRWKRT